MLTARVGRDRSRTEVIIHARSWLSPADSYLHILHLALQNSQIGAATMTRKVRISGLAVSRRSCHLPAVPLHGASQRPPCDEFVGADPPE